MVRPHLEDKELKGYLDIALDAAMAARKIHLHYYKQLKNVRNKQDSSLVSEADHESENAIRQIFRSKSPGIDILGEEEGLEGKSQTENKWIFDPLDGTTNYIHGYPFFCSSIALELNGKVCVGVVDSALLNRTYWAVKGFGSYCDHEKLIVSEASSLKESLLATGFITYGGDNLSGQLDIFKILLETSRGVRRSGSAALELCFLAEGALDGFWEFGLKPWDIAAGSLIIEEAGGKITDDNGKEFNLEKKGIIASNGLIHGDLINAIKGFGLK